MFDRYESVVLLANGIQVNTKTLSQELEKALNSSNPAPVVSVDVEDALITITYPDFRFLVWLITDSNSVEERRVMAQYFGTERGDLDQIKKVQSYFSIHSEGLDHNMDYFNDYVFILDKMEALGQTWALTSEGFLG